MPSNEQLFYQASRKIDALHYARLSALAGCDWDRADRIDRIMERVRKWARWPAQWPERFRSEYGR